MKKILIILIIASGCSPNKWQSQYIKNYKQDTVFYIPLIIDTMKLSLGQPPKN